MLGRVIAEKYKVTERIGTGAMGSIYKAEHQDLSKVFAIKVLHRHLLKDEGQVKRFHREAMAASRLSHPNCISVQDFGQTEDGYFYIAMEYLPGQDLCKIIYDDGKLAPERAVHIAVQVLDALEEAHGNGIIHRDLKPENIMVQKLRSDPEYVKVLDFGIAKIRDCEPGEDSVFKTATGMVFGTPEYMSPEQIQGQELDGRSDLYSLGIVLYQMLTGDVPFSGESIVEVATKHMSEAPVPPDMLCPDLPAALSQAVLKLLAKKRDNRPATAAEAKTLLLDATRDAFTRTTSKVDRSEVSGAIEMSTDKVSFADTTKPTKQTRVGRAAHFGRLLLMLLVLLGSATVTFLVATWLEGR